MVPLHTGCNQTLILQDFEMPMGLGEAEKDVPAPYFREQLFAYHEQCHFTLVGKCIKDLLPANPVMTDYLIDPLP